MNEWVNALLPNGDCLLTTCISMHNQIGTHFVQSVSTFEMTSWCTSALWAGQGHLISHMQELPGRWLSTSRSMLRLSPSVWGRIARTITTGTSIMMHIVTFVSCCFDCHHCCDQGENCPLISLLLLMLSSLLSSRYTSSKLHIRICLLLFWLLLLFCHSGCHLGTGLPKCTLKLSLLLLVWLSLSLLSS